MNQLVEVCQHQAEVMLKYCTITSRSAIVINMQIEYQNSSLLRTNKSQKNDAFIIQRVIISNRIKIVYIQSAYPYDLGEGCQGKHGSLDTKRAVNIENGFGPPHLPHPQVTRMHRRKRILEST